MIILALILLCNASAPDNYHPEPARGANGAKQYVV